MKKRQHQVVEQKTSIFLKLIPYYNLIISLCIQWYENFIEYSKTICGSLRVRLFGVSFLNYSIMITILFVFVYVGSLISSEQLNFLQVSKNNLTLGNCSDYFYQTSLSIQNELEMRNKQNFDKLKSMEFRIYQFSYYQNNLKISNDPCTHKNITLCAQYESSSILQLYKSEKDIQNDIFLSTLFYQNFTPISVECWNYLTQINFLNSHIFDLMGYYDSQQYSFDYIFIVNQKFKAITQFPMVGENFINASLFDKIVSSKQNTINSQSYEYYLQINDGFILAQSNLSTSLAFLEQITNQFYFKIVSFSNNNISSIFNSSVHQLKDDNCELLFSKILLNTSIPDSKTQNLNKGYYSNQLCQKLFIQKIYNYSDTDLYLITYRTIDTNSTSWFQKMLDILPTYFVLFAIIMIIQLIFLNREISFFQRDIINPIKQVTFKLNKILQNVFVPKIISKIQGDDIMIKEGTEVQLVAKEFSGLYQQLSDLFQKINVGQADNIQRSNENYNKEPDKSIEEIKAIVERFLQKN